MSRRAHAKIISVDPSAALKMAGVHGYIDHRDIPGRNLWGPVKPTEEIFASKEVCSLPMKKVILKLSVSREIRWKF